MKRYFIVNYVFFNKDNSFGFGDADVITTESYFNKDNFITKVMSDYSNITTVIIQNVIELNESDYNDYIRK